jgi:hypothetical protein
MRGGGDACRRADTGFISFNQYLLRDCVEAEEKDVKRTPGRFQHLVVRQRWDGGGKEAGKVHSG